jgi:hypothetical protein
VISKFNEYDQKNNYDDDYSDDDADDDSNSGNDDNYDNCYHYSSDMSDYEYGIIVMTTTDML